MAIFNIQSKILKETAVCTLVDVDTGATLYADAAETLPLEIVVSGKASKAYAKALANLARANEKRRAKPMTFEETVEANQRLLAAISVVANNFDLGDGEPIDNKDKFFELYTNPGLYFIRDQVQEFLNEDANFLPV